VTKPKKPEGKSDVGSKVSRAQMADAIHSKHQHIRDAVHKVLHDAGLKGVSLHSIRFSVAHDSISGPGCDPPCPPDQDCVVDSSGGQVQWVCVPR
jgi:hypothetical protein